MSEADILERVGLPATAKRERYIPVEVLWRLTNETNGDLETPVWRPARLSCQSIVVNSERETVGCVIVYEPIGSLRTEYHKVTFIQNFSLMDPLAKGGLVQWRLRSASTQPEKGEAQQQQHSTFTALSNASTLPEEAGTQRMAQALSNASTQPYETEAQRQQQSPQPEDESDPRDQWQELLHHQQERRQRHQQQKEAEALQRQHVAERVRQQQQHEQQQEQQFIAELRQHLHTHDNDVSHDDDEAPPAPFDTAPTVPWTATPAQLVRALNGSGRARIDAGVAISLEAKRVVRHGLRRREAWCPCTLSPAPRARLSDGKPTFALYCVPAAGAPADVREVCFIDERTLFDFTKGATVEWRLAPEQGVGSGGGGGGAQLAAKRGSGIGAGDVRQALVAGVEKALYRVTHVRAPHA